MTKLFEFFVEVFSKEVVTFYFKARISGEIFKNVGRLLIS